MEISEEQLAQIKAHLKVDGDDEDTLIAAYASASVDYVERFCDGALVETLTPPVEGKLSPVRLFLLPASGRQCFC